MSDHKPVALLSKLAGAYYIHAPQHKLAGVRVEMGPFSSELEASEYATNRGWLLCKEVNRQALINFEKEHSI